MCNTEKEGHLLQDLRFLYGDEKAESLYGMIIDRILKLRNTAGFDFSPAWDQKEYLVIAYPDSITDKSGKMSPLAALSSFLKSRCRGNYGVKILPWHPYPGGPKNPEKGDRGFAVEDYGIIAPYFGDWGDVKELADSLPGRLIADFVLNHTSTQHAWFSAFLNQDPRYRRYYIEVEDTSDPMFSKVVKTRPKDPFLHFTDSGGKSISVWSTFNPCQVDLNFKEPDVLLEMLDVALSYVTRGGVSGFRLDALPYTWKELGTSCAFTDESIALLRILRNSFDLICPGATFLPELKKPLDGEAVFYVSARRPAANMTYNYELPALLMDAFAKHDTSGLMKSVTNAARLQASGATTVLNLLGTHDGIPVDPAKNILTEERLESLGTLTSERNGEIYMRYAPDGSLEVKELNIASIDALAGREADPDTKRATLLAAIAIQLSFPGVPAHYINDLVGAGNDHEAYRKTGEKRALHRTNFEIGELTARLDAAGSTPAKVFNGIQDLIELRCREKAFHPCAEAEIFTISEKIFSLIRRWGDGMVLVLVNVSDTDIGVRADTVAASLGHKRARNLIDGETLDLAYDICFAPYKVMWLQPA